MVGGKGVGSVAAGRVIAQDTKLNYTVGFSSSFLGYQVIPVMRYIIIFNQPCYIWSLKVIHLIVYFCLLVLHLRSITLNCPTSVLESSIMFWYKVLLISIQVDHLRKRGSCSLGALAGQILSPDNIVKYNSIPDMHLAWCFMIWTHQLNICLW